MEKDKFNTLEQEIQNLEQTLKVKKEALGSLPPEEKEAIVKNYTQERMETLAPEIKVGLSRPAPEKSPTSPSPSTPSLPSYLINKDEETKKMIGDLINLSEQKGLKTALNELSKMNQPFLTDAFHDTLSLKFLLEIKKRGVI